MFPVISIDGPAASGKSSASKRLASYFGIASVSSGELYRAMTWAALKAGVSADQEEVLDSFLARVEVVSESRGEKVVFLINGQDVTQHLNDGLVNKSISLFSRLPHFRAVLLEPLQNLAKRFPLVMEGRDIGSVVFPETPYKFYLDASEEERERRRLAQGIMDAVGSRDRLDSTRKVAPLVIPVGAHVIDTSRLPLEKVVNQLLKVLKEKNFPMSPA